MRLSFGQEMRLSQKQVLAPRMIQSMEILQLPILALQERIDQELQENPVLEMQETDPDLPMEADAGDSADSGGDEEQELVIDEANGEDDFERLLNMDEEWPDHFDEKSRPSSNRMSEEADRKHDAMANMAARPESLQDHLHDQLSWFDLSADLRKMADRVIYNLDSNGYLQSGLQDLLGADATEEQLKRIEEALRLVQDLEPPGVAAHDLRECLLLQLNPGMLFYEQLHTLISNHLEDIEQNRIPIIAKKTALFQVDNGLALF
jgi:RNA polymerase sigma-54 factor